MDLTYLDHGFLWMKVGRTPLRVFTISSLQKGRFLSSWRYWPKVQKYGIYRAMESFLERELGIFNGFLKWSSGAYKISEIGPAIFKLSPKFETSKTIKLGFLALVHGNEILGLPVLNNILKKIMNRELAPDFEIFFALGNLPAALADKRFLEWDLNRSFGKNSDVHWETRRARELETLMLDQCDYIIDLHQTVSPTEHSFFIFEYSQGLDLSFLTQINPGIPVIVQFEAIGDESGLSTDEYILRRGKFGTAIELGQIGFSEQNFELGISICSRAVEVLTAKEKLEKVEKSFPLFQLDGRCKSTEIGDRLNPGSVNFKKIEKGEVVGTSINGPIYAPESGYMLFPKSVAATSVGQELFYICTPFETKEMGARRLPNFTENQG